VDYKINRYNLTKNLSDLFEILEMRTLKQINKNLHISSVKEDCINFINV